MKPKTIPFNYDGEDDYEIMRSQLPKEIILTKEGNGYRLPDEFVESVNDYLADTYGFCNGGWAVEIKVSNIDWDTE